MTIKYIIENRPKIVPNLMRTPKKNDAPRTRRDARICYAITGKNK